MDMTTTKKNYVKPQITVIEVDMQQMICMSPGGGGDTDSDIDPEDGIPVNDGGPSYHGPFA